MNERAEVNDHDVGTLLNSRVFALRVQEIDATEWTNVGCFSGKSHDITYVPIGPAGKPVQIRVRVRLWKGAAHVGLWSDAVTITVNP